MAEEVVQGTEVIEDDCLDELEQGSSAGKDIYTFAAQLPREYKVKLDQVDAELAKMGKKFSRIKSSKALIDKAHARYVTPPEPEPEPKPAPKPKRKPAKKTGEAATK